MSYPIIENQDEKLRKICENNLKIKEAMINTILEEFILIKLHKKLLTTGNS